MRRDRLDPARFQLVSQNADLRFVATQAIRRVLSSHLREMTYSCFILICACSSWYTFWRIISISCSCPVTGEEFSVNQTRSMEVTILQKERLTLMLKLARAARLILKFLPDLLQQLRQPGVGSRHHSSMSVIHGG